MTIARVVLLALAAFPLVSSAVLAQADPSPASTKPLVFDVASVRPGKAGELFGGVLFMPDGISAKNVPLKYIIRAAYNEWRDAVWFGEPAWTESAAFDIEAKFDPTAIKDATDDQHRAMLRALLADRFKLVVRHETRALPEYALTVARGGPRLRQADAAKYMRDNGNKLYCRAGLTNFRQCTMGEFADVMPRIVGLDKVVLDKTGLTGQYDFELIYTWMGSPVPEGPDAPPDIFDALTEQLGLKLESIKGQADVLVIDHVEKPAEN